MNSAEKTIAALRKKLAACGDCPLAAGATNPVLGEGSPNARVVFVGEGPGKKEDEHGRPFVGSAGTVLNGMLTSVGWERDDVFITNVVNHRPPNNRDPKPDEVKFYAQRFLLPLLAAIDPVVVATLGRHAMQFFIGEEKPMGEMHGVVTESRSFSGHQWNVFPLYHPAAVLYNRSLEEPLRQDFTALAAYIEQS